MNDKQLMDTEEILAGTSEIEMYLSEEKKKLKSIKNINVLDYYSSENGDKIRNINAILSANIDRIVEKHKKYSLDLKEYASNFELSAIQTKNIMNSREV